MGLYVMTMWEPAKAGGSTSPEHVHDIGDPCTVQDIMVEKKAEATDRQKSPGMVP